MASNIPDTHAFPYSAVGLVEVTIGGVAQHAVGVLIAPDEMLTASNVVWQQGVGAASSVVVVPDLNGTDTPFGASVAVTDYHYFQVPDATTLSPTATQDNIALLHLATSITGAANMTPVVNFRVGSAHITGYPDSAGGSSMVDTLEPIFAGGTTVGTPNDPGHGTNGGPVWMTVGSVAQLYGIESNGPSAAEITAPILNLIKSWEAADQAGGLSGAIAVPVPALSHAITIEEQPPAGVTIAESLLFDTVSYLNNNPDVRASGMDALGHFVTFGWHENRAPDPLFDVNYYLSQNPDVAASGMDPLLHYAMYGWKEGRDPSASFSTKGYLAANADVKLAGMDPLQHYLLYGVTEGRST